MSTDNLQALREALFDTLRKVKTGEIELDKARAVNELGKTLIDSAKVEVDYIRAVEGGGSTSTFIEAEPKQLPNGITSITRHRLEG